ncbi:hypothetical protein AVEN_68268-1 [Araneus ventricosus]|uniref:Uncharacterized protein n=1 Tax=Araneus ventricosus TaxID=182803 RepID=A0A4Y2X344_ARAVE|nr:hypothetical protein AVEN_68268-1 [Araneus ventricosus]
MFWLDGYVLKWREIGDIAAEINGDEEDEKEINDVEEDEEKVNDVEEDEEDVNDVVEDEEDVNDVEEDEEYVNDVEEEEEEVNDVEEDAAKVPPTQTVALETLFDYFQFNSGSEGTFSRLDEPKKTLFENSRKQKQSSIVNYFVRE